MQNHLTSVKTDFPVQCKHSLLALSASVKPRLTVHEGFSPCKSSLPPLPCLTHPSHTALSSVPDGV